MIFICLKLLLLLLSSITLSSIKDYVNCSVDSDDNNYDDDNEIMK